MVGDPSKIAGTLALIGLLVLVAMRRVFASVNVAVR